MGIDIYEIKKEQGNHDKKRGGEEMHKNKKCYHLWVGLSLCLLVLCGCGLAFCAPKTLRCKVMSVVTHPVFLIAGGLWAFSIIGYFCASRRESVSANDVL